LVIVNAETLVFVDITIVAQTLLTSLYLLVTYRWVIISVNAN